MRTFLGILAATAIAVALATFILGLMMEDRVLSDTFASNAFSRSLKSLVVGDYCDDCHENSGENMSTYNEKMIEKWKNASMVKLDAVVSKTKKWFHKGCPPPSSVVLSPKSLSVVVRKEYRTLTFKERMRFHECLLEMTKSPAVEPFWDQSEYESFVTQHKFQFSPQAHGSPAFAPYHRVYLFYFERVMKSHSGCENIGLPYWDTTLDSFLPDPSMSAMFTDDSYIGNSKGEVTKGFLAKNWTTVKIPMCVPYGKKLTRAMCSDRFHMMSDAMIDDFINCPNYERCVSPHNDTFEENHGLIHACLGGHMKELICAPYDPLFYMHHSFVDLVFDLYLAKAFPSYDVDASIAYPADKKIDVYYQRGSEPMRPFEGSGLKVRDGMSRNFSRDFYVYQPRPHYCTKAAHCRSKLLWCDLAAKRCKAKAGEDGDCSGLPSEACYCTSQDERPNCSEVTSKCECVDSGGKRKKATAASIRVCSIDGDCKENEWCRQKACESKSYLGEECGNLPDNSCSNLTSVERTGDRSLKPCRSFEAVRCLKGFCACSLPMIRCGASSAGCPAVDQVLWCDPSSGLCLYRGRPGESCDKKGHDSCGHCAANEFAVCSKKSKTCLCLTYDDVAEVF